MCILFYRINKIFKELRIQTNLEYNKEDTQLAGKINSIIETLNTVLVQPIAPDILLYFGTPLFLNQSMSQNCRTKYILLGYIDDIFGSIGEPIYSITMKSNPKDILNINAHVYYFPNNPSTVQVYVEHTIDKISNKEKYSIITKNL